MRYQPLEHGQIRLLQLDSRQRTAPDSTIPKANISGHLEYVSLDSQPNYIALSYRSGEDKPCRILVDDEVTKISENLMSALLQVLNRHGEITVWVDAICIDQENMSEKGEQVRLMKSIFRTAQHVFAWLGPAADDGDVAMDYLKDLGERAASVNIRQLLMNVMASPDEKQEDELIRAREEFETHVGGLARSLEAQIMPMKAIHTFLGREYWQRMWIVQEVSLSCDISYVCGTRCCSHDQLWSALTFLPYLVTYVFRFWVRIGWEALNAMPPDYQEFSVLLQTNYSLDRRALTLLGRRRPFKNDPYSLFRLVAKFNTVTSSNTCSLATDPLDRIYALLGQAPDADTNVVYPNYQVGVRRAYTDVARSFIEQGHVDVLSYSQFAMSSRPITKESNVRLPGDNELPSWVPDWRKQILRPRGLDPWDTASRASSTHEFRSMQQGDDKDDDNHQSPNPFELSLMGCVVDGIKSVGTPWTPSHVTPVPYDDRLRTYLDEIRELCRLSDAIDANDIYRTPDDRKCAHWRIPVGDLEHNELGLERRATDLSRVGYDGTVQNFTDFGARNDNTPAKASYQNLLGYQFHRRPFISPRGFVGLAPAHAQEGDQVCIFLGAKFPYILRPTEKAKYQFIGEAYVHGIMYGEFMDSGPQLRKFVLT